MSRNRKTNDSQASGIPRARRRGGQPGNRNAVKPVTPLSAAMRDLDRRIRAALARARGKQKTGACANPAKQPQ